MSGKFTPVIEKQQGKFAFLSCAFLSMQIACFGGQAAHAEYYPTGEGYGSTTSLRSPLIQGSYNTQPYQCAPQGQLPAIGDGFSPMPVNPGHIGPAPKPPSHVDVPLAGPYDGPMVNGALSPYLQPPPSTTGQNSGMFPGHGGLTPPVNWTNINPNGGMYGCAPIQRWGGQVTRDMGYLRSFGSKLTDFGVDVDQLTPVKRATSEEGPRPATYPGVQGSPTNRQTNLAGAQGTTDLHGNRSMFHKSGSLPRMTIAPY